MSQIVTRSMSKSMTTKFVVSDKNKPNDIISDDIISDDIIPVLSVHLTQKMFVFVAENAPIAVIIRKERIGQAQLIKWDMTTNKFTEGPWLINRELCIGGCAISPDGLLFGWVYKRLNVNGPNGLLDGPEYAGVSRVLNFTTELFKTGLSIGTKLDRWLRVEFDEDSNPLAGKIKFERQTETPIPLSKKEARPNGLQTQTFTTKNGNVILVDKYKILCDGVEIYDATENKFVASVARKPFY